MLDVRLQDQFQVVFSPHSEARLEEDWRHFEPVRSNKAKHHYLIWLLKGFHFWRSILSFLVGDEPVCSAVDDLVDIEVLLIREQDWLLASSDEKKFLCPGKWSGLQLVLDNSSDAGLRHVHLFSHSSHGLNRVPLDPQGVGQPGGDDSWFSSTSGFLIGGPSIF